jgi:hypothetical protein
VEKEMIVIKREVLENWLNATGRNYKWLAERLGHTKGYISQVVSNRCRISSSFIDGIIQVTNISFEKLFYNDGTYDDREFYGAVYVLNGQKYNRQNYREYIANLSIDERRKIMLDRKRESLVKIHHHAE